MAHMPVNHRLLPLYRVLAAACGLYILVFGVVALVATRSNPTFAQDNLPWVLGLRANRGFALLSVAAGITLVGGAVIGGMLDRWINLVSGLVFLVAGMAMMVLMQTSLNVLGFTMTTCIVSFVIGMVLLAAGLYGQVGSATRRRREEDFRHGQGPDPEHHLLGAESVPRG